MYLMTVGKGLLLLVLVVIGDQLKVAETTGLNENALELTKGQ